jgi:branched-chain amino acid transport system substrate-binding protein
MATIGSLPVAQAFAKEFRAANGKDPDQIHAMSYDAATAAILAIEKAGKADRTAIRDALREVSFDSVRGKFSFDQKGDPTFPTHIVLVKEGQETDGRAAK